MNFTSEQAQKEINKRFEILERDFDVLPFVREQFQKDGTVSMFENINSYKADDELKSLIAEIETEMKIKIYACIHSKASYGELFSFLYISRFEEEWDIDNKELQAGYPMAYVYNKDFEMFSEFGSISIKGLCGAILRVA